MTKSEAVSTIVGWGLVPGATIHTVLRHHRGNHRRISMLWFKPERMIDGPDSVRIFTLDRVAEALGVAKRRKVSRRDSSGYSWDDYEEGLVTSGGGMDMGFHLVYEFGRALADAQGLEKPRDPGYDFQHSWI